jgi:hypothetical protein
MKMIYKRLIKREHEIPQNALEKWERDLRMNIPHDKILKAHAGNHWSLINHKLRSYNCNFLNRNIPTNRRLTYMNKKTDSKCKWCKKEEDIKHLYWECGKARRIWKKLGQLYRAITGKTFILRKEKCLLGISNTEKHLTNKQTLKLQRSLCILTKHYIHLCKCNDEAEPTEIGLEHYLLEYIRTEKWIAEKNNSMTAFLDKWGRWSEWSEWSDRTVGV